MLCFFVEGLQIISTSFGSAPRKNSVLLTLSSRLR